MNRRSFLKRVAAATVGVCVAPSIVLAPSKTIPSVAKSKSLPRQDAPLYPLGTRKVLPDGRIFRYMKAAEKIPKGEIVEFAGISMGDGWAQTYGPCVVKMGKPEPDLINLTGF